MASSIVDPVDLPLLTPRTHCVLLARDPHVIYAYWDHTQEDITRLRGDLIFRKQEPKFILRVYDKTSVRSKGTHAEHCWDIEVGLSVKKKYIDVWQANTEYFVEFGASCDHNHFVPLMRSNSVCTPPSTTSKRDDLIWQEIKTHKESRPYIQQDIQKHYKQLFPQSSSKGTPKARQDGKKRVYYLSSHDIRVYYSKFFAGLAKRSGRTGLKGFSGIPQGISWQKVHPVVTGKQLIQKVHPGSSEVVLTENNNTLENVLNAPSGGSEARLKQRDFFFEVSTELIVHGRTEPDASVKLNDKDIKLNPDGTFSLRFALPDGKIPLVFLARSADQLEARHIQTHVQRTPTSGYKEMFKDFHGKQS